MVDDQVGGVALAAVAGADLDDPAALGADQREQVQQDAVLAALRVALELDIRQLGERSAAVQQVAVLQAQGDLRDLGRRRWRHGGIVAALARRTPQNMVLSLAAIGGTRCSTSQCSTILPASS